MRFGEFLFFGVLAVAGLLVGVAFVQCVNGHAKAPPTHTWMHTRVSLPVPLGFEECGRILDGRVTELKCVVRNNVAWCRGKCDHSRE